MGYKDLNKERHDGIIGLFGRFVSECLGLIVLDMIEKWKRTTPIGGMKWRQWELICQGVGGYRVKAGDR